MSRVAKSLVRSRRSTTSATIDSSESPSAARRAAVRQRLPRPIDALCESITCTGTSPDTAAAATWAACIVAERCDERLMHTMPVAPRACSSRNLASNAPADGAAVSGSSLECSSRCQNSSVLSSTRSTSSSSPKRMVSGTISMRSASTSGCGRSQLLSVTTRMLTRAP